MANTNTDQLSTKNKFLNSVKSLNSVGLLKSVDEYNNSSLQSTSRYKIKDLTVKKMSFVSFNKKNDRYLLKNVILNELNEQTQTQTYLCFFSHPPQISTQSSGFVVTAEPFALVPVFNKYFIFDNSALPVNTKDASLNTLGTNFNQQQINETIPLGSNITSSVTSSIVVTQVVKTIINNNIFDNLSKPLSLVNKKSTLDQKLLLNNISNTNINSTVLPTTVMPIKSETKKQISDTLNNLSKRSKNKLNKK